MPESLATSFRVATAKLPDGTHRLAVTVTDAAGNATTVLRRTIVTDNPQRTPRPAHGLRARFAISWRWARTVTELRTITAAAVPRAATVAVSCTGRHCPRLPARAVSGSHLRTLLHRLRGTRLHPGDALLITVRARHRRPERIRLTIRRGARPRVRLLASRR